MTIETLVAASDKDGIDFLENMNLCTDAVVVNRCGYDDKKLCKTSAGNKVLYINTAEYGLSKCRNAAISNATADICVLSDDGFIHSKSYDKIIEEAYMTYPDADLITFQLMYGDSRLRNYHPQPYRHNRFTALRPLPGEISFRPESINRVCLRFDENFGQGTPFAQVEQTVFLGQCIARGLRVYYIPVVIGSLSEESFKRTKNLSRDDIISTGAAYKALDGFFFPVYSLIFAIVRHKDYCNSCSFLQALLLLLRGSGKYKKYLKKERAKNG